MLKKDILDLMEKFEAETWKYSDNDNLDNDMQYFYSIEKKIKKGDDTWSVQTLAGVDIPKKTK